MENKSNHRLVPRVKIFVVLSFLASILWFVTTTFAKGQNKNIIWNEPLNLSRSGGASNPVLVVDSNNQQHVIWQDSFDGVMVTNRIDNVWSEPQIGNFPFETTLPELLADSRENIHAFWQDQQGRLAYSQINGSNFGTANTWSGVATLSDSVLRFNSTIDENGVIHLVYIRNTASETAAAGIYYRNSINNGITWSAPVILDESLYLRLLTADSARIYVTTSVQSETETSVYVVWDNIPLRRIYFTRSDDNGLTWLSGREIDGPPNTSGLSAPFNLNISVNQNDILLVWQVGQEDVVCTQYYQYSSDRGDTWTDRKSLLRDLSAGGCPQDNRIIGRLGDETLLLTKAQNQIFLTAWDGTQWSNPNLQNTLSGFIDPVSQANVNLGCLDIEVHENKIFVVGCGISTGEDIWFIDSNIPDFSDWYPSSSAWSIPDSFSARENSIQSLHSVADLNGAIHAIWLEPSGIYHSKWEGDQWIVSSKIINGSFVESDELAIAIDSNGIIYIVWTQDENGELFFSWANSSKATDKNEWIEPIRVTTQNNNFNSPDILINNQSRIFIVYTIPINEGRGVYSVISDDIGNSWSDPVKIFDAVSDGWEIVGNTQIVEVIPNQYMITIEKATLSGGRYEIHFFKYFPNTQEISTNFLVNQNISYSELDNVLFGTVHEVWQSENEDQLQIWHTFSTNAGEDWEQPGIVTSLGEVPGPFTLSLTNSNNANLTYISQTGSEFLRLNHIMWNNSNWDYIDDIQLQLSDIESIQEMSSAISSNGDLVVIYATKDDLSIDESTPYVLYYVKKNIGISDSVTPNDIEITPTQITETPVSTPIPEPTPEFLLTERNELALNEIQDGGESSATTNLIYRIGTGVISAIVIIIISAAVIAISRRRRR